MVHLTGNIAAFFVILIQRILVSGAIFALWAMAALLFTAASAVLVRRIIRSARRDR